VLKVVTVRPALQEKLTESGISSCHGPSELIHPLPPTPGKDIGPRRARPSRTVAPSGSDSVTSLFSPWPQMREKPDLHLP